MLPTDLMIRTNNRPLEETEDILNSVCVDITSNPLLIAMADCFISSVMVCYSLVGRPIICIYRFCIWCSMFAYELDSIKYWPDREPLRPHGAVDGKVMGSNLAEELSFWARWGNSSGMPFDAEKFLAEHIQWGYLEGYLKDRPSQPWTLFRAGEK